MRVEWSRSTCALRGNALTPTAADLDSIAWSDLGEPVVGRLMFEMSDPMTFAGQRFYRVVVVDVESP
jgi:hypothetical protein